MCELFSEIIYIVAFGLWKKKKKPTSEKLQLLNARNCWSKFTSKLKM